MPEVSLFRLYLLRAVYLLLFVGLLLTMWPLILDHGPDWPRMNGVVACLLGALGLLCGLGLRYPLQMLLLLLLLLFEFTWKTIWSIAVVLPLWRAGAVDPVMAQSMRDILPGLLLVLVIPWRYVLERYVRRPGDRWRPAPAAEVSPAE